MDVKGKFSALAKGIMQASVVGCVVNEICNYYDSKLINKRLLELESSVLEQGILLEDFIEKLTKMQENEHKYYVVRNNIKYLITTALPETVDTYNKALINIIMQDEYSLPEHVAEIIQQLNAEDIRVLADIKEFIKDRKNKNAG